MSTTCLAMPLAASRAPVEVSRPRRGRFDLARLAAAYGICWLHALRHPALAGSQALGRFAVPFFVFAAVFFVFQGLGRRPQRTFAEYARSRLVRIYVPFLAWSGIYLLFKLAKGLLVPGQPNAYPGVSVLWAGSAYHLWFMPFILIVCLLAFGIAKITLGRPSLERWVCAAAVAAGILLMATPTPQTGPWSEGCGYMVAYALPAVCWAVGLALALRHPAARYIERPSASVAAGVVIAVSIAWTWGAGGARLAENLAGLGFMVLALGSYAPAWMGRLGKLGPLAYGIYLSHLLFIKVLEAVTAKLGLGAYWQLDVGTFLVTAIASTLLAWGLSRWRSTRWLVC